MGELLRLVGAGRGAGAGANDPGAVADGSLGASSAACAAPAAGFAALFFLGSLAIAEAAGALSAGTSSSPAEQRAAAVSAPTEELQIGPPRSPTARRRTSMFSEAYLRTEGSGGRGQRLGGDRSRRTDDGGADAG